MTLSAIQKAEMDRGILCVDINIVERKIIGHKTTPLNPGAVNSLLDTVSKIQASLFETHSRIAYQSPVDMTPHETEYVRLLEKLTNAKAELMEIQHNLSTSASSSTASTSSTSDVKLPRLELPSFDGKYEDWPSFENLFNADVGKTKLPGAKKLQYLKTCVTGEAASLIKAFTITDQNFTEAWNTLSTRYNHEGEIIYSLCKKILYQQHLKSESVTGLKQLLNTTMESVRSLKVMGQPTDKWDSLLVVSVVEKFDPDTRSEWAKTRASTTPATFQEVTDFLEKQVRVLLAKGSQSTKPATPNSNSKNQQSAGKQRTFHVTAAPSTCSVCKGSHLLYQCSKLREMDASQRTTAVRRSSACLNCLRDGHSAKDCKSVNVCRVCSMKHHTLLHIDYHKSTSGSGNATAASTTQSTTPSSSQVTVRTNIASAPEITTQRVFKTAVVHIEDSLGIQRPCRVLFDDCSEAEYITENCASALGLPKTKANVIVEGVAGVTAARCKAKVSAKLQSIISEDSYYVESLYVIPKITGYIPRLPCNTSDWSYLNGLQLADPQYDQPGDIDILIGTGVVSYIMKDGIVHGTAEQPVAYNSIFGWVLSGTVNTQPPRVLRTHHTTCKLEELVQRFWEVEQIPLQTPFTPIEAEAEQHFISTHCRKPDGRYVVRLPFNSKISSVGDTKELALHRLYQLERRFKRYPEYHHQYKQFMQEYLQLGHMEVVTEQSTIKRVYIPHHFVRKEDSTTTKLRVVFDASMKSTSGVSLNDTLLVGPTIQDELFTQLIRFRTHPIALKADIAKMYRQFEVHENDRPYQTILWRESPEDPVQEYQLKTVTYGTACAPYLATRCLQQLATDEEVNFPDAAKAMKNMMYIDDLLGGSGSREKCISLFEEMTKLCAAGCLDIRKWCSSDSEVLDAVPPEMKEEGFHDFDIDTSVKALGIRWRAQEDYFYFQVEAKALTEIITKRQVLSEIARTFDPLGWLTPTTVTAKIRFQDLWKETTDWDAPVSKDIHSRWNQYCSDLKQHIPMIKIPRRIIPDEVVDIQLHGYCDSSEKAMACCLYLRSTDSSGNITTHLVTSRSRIAPIKMLSIPRLELNSAVLLAETLESVVKSFNFNYSTHAWTDSMITLSWLTSTNRRWKSYVATRVATIQEIIPSRCWNHVRSSDNPADLPSRGIPPEDLTYSTLWWQGPPWLSTNEFPQSHPVAADEEELAKEGRLKVSTLHTGIETTSADLLFQYSSLTKVITVTAWLRRLWKFSINKLKCPSGPLSVVEREGALNILIRYVQNKMFSEEFQHLKTNKQVSQKSKIMQLNPFLDKTGILRVGGRLANAPISSEVKQPIIVPHNHPFTTLIVRDQHHRTLHGGFTVTLAMIRRKYWIIRSRDVVRQIIRRCVTCKKIKAAQSQQQMGNLPSARVTSNRPFLHCGVDYAGSFPVRMRSGRGPAGIDKCYMAVFVCFSTKAVHLEPVTSLSTAAFIACLRRFTARRGIPSHLYSDCGTNFVGADKELQRMLTEQSSCIQQYCSVSGIKWVFNPPSAPHQGGLWEAAVKSAKFHLKRIVGNNITTFEQFSTLLCNVEACLNSRPLCPLSTDPADLDALTPGHFLVGEPLLAIPEGDLTMEKENRLEQWQRVQQMTQHFWRRWKQEYLITLQQRQKWNKLERNLSVGDLVIVREDCLPPTKWKMGRITATHPGNDGLVRKATVKTASGDLIRPIVKLLHLEELYSGSDNLPLAYASCTPENAHARTVLNLREPPVVQRIIM